MPDSLRDLVHRVMDLKLKRDFERRMLTRADWLEIVALAQAGLDTFESTRTPLPRSKSADHITN